MARKHMVSPSFFTDRRVGACTPLARLFLMGLWGIADASGRVKNDPAELKLRLLPKDECDPGALLDELVHQGQLVRSEFAGRSFLAIPHFGKVIRGAQ